MKKPNFWTKRLGCVCVHVCAERDGNLAKPYSIPSHQRTATAKPHNALIWQWPILRRVSGDMDTRKHTHTCVHT